MIPISLRPLLRVPPHGGAAVEFALVLPFLVGLMVGLFDIGFGLYQAMQVQAAAEAGAQYAVEYAWDPNSVSTAVVAATGARGISATPAPNLICGCPDSNPFAVAAWVTDHCSPSVTCPSGSAPGVYAVVNAQIAYRPLLPYPRLPAQMTITGTAYRRLN